MRWFVIPGVAAVTMVGALVVAGGGAPTTGSPSNYRSRILAVEPARAGIEVRSVQMGDQLELVNRSGDPVTVLGYQDEPYLRVDAGGVHENTRSPTLQASRGDLRPGVATDVTPRWREVDGGVTVRWHDHRAHWMGSADPPEVAAAPDRRHVVTPWEVPLLVDGELVAVAGQLTWVPPPRPWPCYLVAGAAAVLVVGLALSRWRRRALPLATDGLLVVTVVSTAGSWAAAADGGVTDQLSSLVLPVLATTPAVIAWGTARRDERNRLLLLGATIAGLGGLVGASRVAWLDRSQLPTGLDPGLARLTVPVALGLALGGLFVVARRVGAVSRPPPAAARPGGSDCLAAGTGVGVVG
jgi:hypothetical protein